MQRIEAAHSFPEYLIPCWQIVCLRVSASTLLVHKDLKRFFPVYFNFKQHQVSPAAYLPDWLMSLFLEHLPLDACARVWDVIALEGDSFLFRAALAVLSGLESRLFFPDRQELLDLLG